MPPVPADARAGRGSERLILRHCLALDAAEQSRRPARTRLEESIGPALAHRLVSSLSLTRRGVRR